MSRCAIVMTGCLLAGCLGPISSRAPSQIDELPPPAIASPTAAKLALTPRERLGDKHGRPRAAMPEEIQKMALDAIKAYEFKLGVIVDNLANADTIGFKRRRVLYSFECV